MEKEQSDKNKMYCIPWNESDPNQIIKHIPISYFAVVNIFGKVLHNW